MRVLGLVVGLLALSASSGWAAISDPAVTTCSVADNDGGATATCTLTGNATANNLIVCGAGWNSSGIGITSLTYRSGAESFTVETRNTITGTSVVIGHLVVTTGGAADILLTIASGTGTVRVSCIEVSGAATSSVRDQIAENDQAGGADPFPIGTITPSADNYLVVAVTMLDSAATLSSGPTGYARVGTQTFMFFYYDIQGTAASTSADAIDYSTSETGVGIIASYKVAAAAAAGGPVQGTLLTLGVQ